MILEQSALKSIQHSALAFSRVKMRFVCKNKSAGDRVWARPPALHQQA